VGACFWILLIGLTRIYLGAHYLTDVLGALAAGLFWLAFSWTAFETLRWRRHSTRCPNS
jgi:membrane-associated phospholipid phosphatase